MPLHTQNNDANFFYDSLKLGIKISGMCYNTGNITKTCGLLVLCIWKYGNNFIHWQEKCGKTYRNLKKSKEIIGKVIEFIGTIIGIK